MAKALITSALPYINGTVRLTTILKINAEVNEASIQEKNLILTSAEQPDRLKSTEAVYQ